MYSCRLPEVAERGAPKYTYFRKPTVKPNAVRTHTVEKSSFVHMPIKGPRHPNCTEHTVIIAVSNV
jgi:hypothetical protein